MVVSGTGHRPNKLGGYSKEVLHSLIDIAKEYLSQNLEEVTKVISGMAIGWDTALALAALELSIPLECAIPFKGQESRWPKKSQDLFNEILDRSDLVTYVSDPGFSPYKMQKRNEYMVDNCDILLAMWDGRGGSGTYNCLEYAKEKGKIVVNLYNKLKTF